MVEKNNNQRDFPAVVANISDDYTIVINRGADDGIRNGQQFLIYSIGEEVIDPESGESLGQLEIVRGRGVVKHCQPRMATIESNEKQKAKVVKRRNVGLLAMGSEVTEESNEGKILPFDTIEIGDKAKLL